MRLSLFLIIAFPFAFISQAQAAAKIKFGQDEIKLMFSQLRTVGGAMEVLRMTTSTEEYEEMKKLILHDGMKESDLMPEFKFNGTSVGAAGLAPAFDMSNLPSGQITKNGNSWIWDKKKSKAENYRALREFMIPKKQASFPNLLFPEANAQSGGALDPIKSAGMIVLGSHAFYNGLIWLAVGGTSIASASGAALAAGGAALILAAESSYKGGARYLTGSTVYCEKGKVMIKDSYGRKEEAKWAVVGQVGIAELKIREQFCSDESMLARVNAAFSGSGGTIPIQPPKTAR